jgi:hypothetical protein
VRARSVEGVPDHMWRPRHDSHLNLHAEMVRGEPDEGAVERDCVLRVPHDRDSDRLDLTSFAARGVEIDPARARQIDLRPDMRRDDASPRATPPIKHSPPNVGGFEIEEFARTFPFDYGVGEMPDLARYIERHQPDPGNELGRWTRGFLPSNGSMGSFEFLTGLTLGINHGFRYRRREAKVIQEPRETLRRGHVVAATSPCS